MLRDVLKAGMTKSEIEQFLKSKGDYVQIDHLGRFLKEPLHMEIKKFVFLKLAVLYEKAKMFNEAAKMYNNVADLSIPFVEKINYHMKEAELYSRIGAFDRVELAMKKAMSQANSREKEEIYASVKQFYKEQAKANETLLKRNQAIKFYEKILEMRSSEQERAEIKQKLMDLYKKVGKLHEYSAVERSFGQNA